MAWRAFRKLRPAKTGLCGLHFQVCVTFPENNNRSFWRRTIKTVTWFGIRALAGRENVLYLASANL